jgi:hypothetical protein
MSNWLNKILGRGEGAADAAPVAPSSYAPTEPAVAPIADIDLSLDVLVAENLRLGAEIDRLRERRKALKPLIDQKVREREQAAPLGPGSAVIKGE